MCADSRTDSQSVCCVVSLAASAAAAAAALVAVAVTAATAAAVVISVTGFMMQRSAIYQQVKPGSALI